MKALQPYIYAFIAILLHPSASICHTDAYFQRVAYVHVAQEDWAHYAQLFDGTYTHIVAAFLLPDGSGTLTAVDAARAFSPSLIRKARSKGIRVLVSIGGATVSYRVYLDIAENPAARRRFIRNTLVHLDKRGYDGVDLDFEGWFEGLSSAQRDEVNALIEELAQAVKHSRAHRLVTLALAPLYWLPMSADCDLINSDGIDLAHHMSYDFDVGSNGPNGPWRNPGKQQYLYPGRVATERSVWGALNYLLAQGCRADKLTAGIPFYDTAKQAWSTIADRRNWQHVPIDPQFLEKADPQSGTWVNDPQAVIAKVQAYRRLGLAGAIVWQVGHEGTSARLSKALLSASRGPAASDHAKDAGSPPLRQKEVLHPASAVSAGPAQAELAIRSDWGSGYCADVRVSNPCPTALLWQVSLSMDDTIQSIWDAGYTLKNQRAIISGAAWNRRLAAGQSIVFGFCATRGHKGAGGAGSTD